jgi:hypothetical protein
MRSLLAVALVGVGLLMSAVEVDAWGSGGGSGGGPGTGHEVRTNLTNTTSVPEPSTLYALGSAVALLGGAGWYIRRRK